MRGSSDQGPSELRLPHARLGRVPSRPPPLSPLVALVLCLPPSPGGLEAQGSLLVPVQVCPRLQVQGWAEASPLLPAVDARAPGRSLGRFGGVGALSRAPPSLTSRQPPLSCPLKFPLTPQRSLGPALTEEGAPPRGQPPPGAPRVSWREQVPWPLEGSGAAKAGHLDGAAEGHQTRRV